MGISLLDMNDLAVLDDDAVRVLPCCIRPDLDSSFGCLWPSVAPGSFLRAEALRSFR